MNGSHGIIPVIAETETPIKSPINPPFPCTLKKATAKVKTNPKPNFPCRMTQTKED